jgi:hypothetical protein
MMMFLSLAARISESAYAVKKDGDHAAAIGF